MKTLFTLLISLNCLSLFATVQVVSVANFFYSPKDLLITVGDTVRFNWVSGSHPTASDSGSWVTFPMDAGNTSFDLILPIGHYPYHCTNHGSIGGVGMSGTITVLKDCSGLNTTGSLINTSCVSYTAPSGKIFTSTGMHNDTILNAAGCDSVITIDLTIKTVDITYTQNDTSIISNAIAASYQWLDCNNSFMAITNDTNQAYQPSVSGFYAVEISQNGCVDTSVCVNFAMIGIADNSLNNEISIYPSPAKNNLNISFANRVNNLFIKVYNVSGALMLQKNLLPQEKSIDVEALSSGIYFIKLEMDDETFYAKFVKE